MTLSTIRPITVSVLHESELVVSGVRAMLATQPGFVVTPEHRPADIVLYDPVRLPSNGPAHAYLRSAPRVVVYTAAPSSALATLATSRGARGVLCKELGAASLRRALTRIHAGEVVIELGAGGGPGSSIAGLTGRESEVITHIASGLSNADIAEAMSLRMNSIKSYIRSAYRKMEVESRSQAVLWAVKHGYVALDDVVTTDAEDGPHHRHLRVATVKNTA